MAMVYENAPLLICLMEALLAPTLK